MLQPGLAGDLAMYAETTIYEVHARSKGQWRTLGTYDDANAAVAEAVRLRHSHHYLGIRVTEALHDTVDAFSDRVIYRYTVEQSHHSAIPAICQTSIIDSPDTGTRSPNEGASSRRERASAGWIGEWLTRRLGLAIVIMLFTLITIGTT